MKIDMSMPQFIEIHSEFFTWMVEKVQLLSGETSDTFGADNIVIKALKEGSVDVNAIVSMQS